MLTGGGLAHRFYRWLGSEGLPFEEKSDEGFEPPTPRARELWERYGLATRALGLSAVTLREILGTLDLLDRLPSDCLEPVLPERGTFRQLDVGAKNWRYATALACWLERSLGGSLPARVDGVEIDAHRWFLNLRSRASYGKFFAARATEASRSGRIQAPVTMEYHAGDVRDRGARQDVDLVTWLFPFVLPEPHGDWGLPSRLFAPRECFEAVSRRLLRPGGKLVLANQGDWEWKATEELVEGLPLRHLRLEVVEGSLHACRYPIFLTLWIRED